MADMLCILGTDTDAGKTVVAAGIARAARNRGLRVLVIKPVQTGSIAGDAGERLAPDVMVYQTAASGAITGTVVVFKNPCSPHLAARQEGIRLDARALADKVRQTVREHPADLVLLEGAGGLLTPISETETMLDVCSLLDWPLVLVAPNRLGVVNHALLSLEAARGRGLGCRGFVMNTLSEPATPLEQTIRDDNSGIISRLGGVPCLAAIPLLKELPSDDGLSRERAWDILASILEPVLNAGRRNASLPETRNIEAFDRDHIWHPYTSAVYPLRSREAVATNGVRIKLKDGRELVDGMASWWCAIHGYRHPALIRALHDQAGRMPHVMFGGLTHEPAVNLAAKLLEITPRGLEHVFFADSGSVAVEVALKMALQYQQASGTPRRTKILALRGGYHGDTLGAMSVCDPVNGMHSLFTGVLPEQVFAPRPECRFAMPYDASDAAAFERVLQRHADSLAAVILEPIVQGAGGMWFYHPDFLRRVRALCDAYGCLLIADEIATGFGRTGELFACEHAGVSPDIMCVGKGLTGGVMTLAATLSTRTVARGISREGGVLMHGPTFMANPLACAVACASLDLLADGSWRADVGRIEARLRQGLSRCAGEDGVHDVRVLGAIGVVEMNRPVNVEKLQTYFVDCRGVWIRPFGRLIYVMPPYICDDADIDALTGAICGAAKGREWA